MPLVKPHGLPMRTWRDMTPAARAHTIAVHGDDSSHRCRLNLTSEQRAAIAAAVDSERTAPSTISKSARRPHGQPLGGALAGCSEVRHRLQCGREYCVYYSPSGARYPSLVKLQKAMMEEQQQPAPAPTRRASGPGAVRRERPAEPAYIPGSGLYSSDSPSSRSSSAPPSPTISRADGTA
jgi:hypothetical protein